MARRRRAVKQTRNRQKNVTAEDVAKWKKLYDGGRGMSITAIADKFDRSRACVSLYVIQGASISTKVGRPKLLTKKQAIYTKSGIRKSG